MFQQYATVQDYRREQGRRQAQRLSAGLRSAQINSAVRDMLRASGQLP